MIGVVGTPRTMVSRARFVRWAFGLCLGSVWCGFSASAATPSGRAAPVLEPVRTGPDSGALLQKLAGRAARVVVGRVHDVESVAGGPHGDPGIFRRVRVSVYRTLRGPKQGTLEFWAHGGTLGRRRRVVRGQAEFSPGEEVLLFLSESRDGSLWPTGMARGKWRVRLADDDWQLEESEQP